MLACTGARSDQGPSPRATTDLKGALSACANGVAEYSSLAPTPLPVPSGATQSLRDATVGFNRVGHYKPPFVLTPDGWAAATDKAGTVLYVLTFEEWAAGFFAPSQVIACRR